MKRLLTFCLAAGFAVTAVLGLLAMGGTAADSRKPSKACIDAMNDVWNALLAINQEQRDLSRDFDLLSEAAASQDFGALDNAAKQARADLDNASARVDPDDYAIDESACLSSR